MARRGLHSNGYSLVRHVLLDAAGCGLDRHVAELGRTLGEEMLEPTRIYALDCLALARAPRRRARASRTSPAAGSRANLARVLPGGLRRATSTARPGRRPPVFGLVGELGGVAQPELERTLNMGVGMVAVVAADVGRRRARAAGEPAGCRPGCSAR